MPPKTKCSQKPTGYVARHNSSCKKKDIIKLFEEAKSHIDAERWAKFETHVEREFEEKLRQLDGIRDEDVNPVVIDITDDDSQDSQRTIPYMFSEGEEEGNDDENDKDFEDSGSRNFNPVPYQADHFGQKIHLDQNEKLMMFGVTHVIAVDGYSGKGKPNELAFLKAHTGDIPLELLPPGRDAAESYIHDIGSSLKLHRDFAPILFIQKMICWNVKTP
ncbi:unnamed protein product [Mytilus coruscus]|uniref:Uncharacterized protein n=1 Tax=Mytilus coruscus TaxID=42192 RepID=A0A6J8APK6_MYTCO|nr:unnamed protein product [Mytilus coruscus]